MIKMRKKNPKDSLRIDIGVALLAICAFIIYIVGHNYETNPTPFDLSVQAAFFSLRNPVLNAIICAITHLSDTYVIIAFCAILLVLPWTRKNYGIPVSILCAVGVGIYKPLKSLIHRARPDISNFLVEQDGFSFPSGHAVTSILFYGFLAFLIIKCMKNEKAKKILATIAIALAVLIGPSRIYVGVHWPTDVLCGWALAGGLLMIAIVVRERVLKAISEIKAEGKTNRKTKKLSKE